MFKFTFIKNTIIPFQLCYQYNFFKTFKNYQDYGNLPNSNGKNVVPVQISKIFVHHVYHGHSINATIRTPQEYTFIRALRNFQIYVDNFKFLCKSISLV